MLMKLGAKLKLVINANIEKTCAPAEVKKGLQENPMAVKEVIKRGQT